MSIVNKVRSRVRCEVHPCKNKAVAAIGPENRRQICFNVCEEHLRQIVEDGAALLAESNEGNPIPSGREAHPAEDITATETSNAAESQETDKSDTAPLSGETVDGGQTLDDGAETPHTEPTDSKNGQIGDVDIQIEPEKPSFTCKHCGAGFDKKTDLMSHAKVCPKKPPKES